MDNENKKSFLQKSWKIIKRIVTNKYLLASIIFLLLITFSSRHSLIDRVRSVQRISALEKEKRQYEKEIEQSKQKINNLENNPEVLEKYAREQYFMKAEDEDVFLIE